MFHPLLFSISTMLLSSSSSPEVVIIGAGWSGMSAAHHLALANVSFVVLEARNYTGGRTHAIQFGDPSVGQHTMEIGSGWLESSGQSGGPEKSPPPVSAQAAKCGLKVAFVPGSTQNMSNYRHVYTADGVEGDPDGSIRARANAAYACISKMATKKHEHNPTVREALTTCGWTPSTPVEHAVDWALTVDDPGMVPEEQALKLTLPDEVYEWWGPDDRFVVDQNPRGYAHVLDTLLAETVPSGDPRVVFNHHVTGINYSKHGVVVTATDTTAGGAGKVVTFDASLVISTMPLGVLKHDHASIFTPALPHKYQKVLDDDTFLMSNLTRIYLQFPSVFWDDSVTDWIAAVDGNTTGADGQKVGPGYFPEFRNMNHPTRVPGSKILLLFIGNPESVTYEAMSDDAVSKVVMDRIRRMYPSSTVPDPSAFHMTRWGLDPLARGCYSAFKPGFDDDEYSIMAKPIKVKGKARVYFGGEAMCDDLSGSTYGAYQSGRQIAEEYLWNTGRKDEKPVDLCWA